MASSRRRRYSMVDTRVVSLQRPCTLDDDGSCDWIAAFGVERSLFLAAERSMATETTDSEVCITRLDPKASLASLNARVWFLGCGVGCATGLSLTSSFIAILQNRLLSIAIPALIIALIHASIITVLWVYRFSVHRRTAMMISMLASSILTVALAILMASGEMTSSPLHGLAFMQVVFAFFHPAILVTTKNTE